MKKLFQSKTFFDNNIVDFAKLSLNEIIKDEKYSIVLSSTKVNSGMDFKGTYNSAIWKFQAMLDSFHAELDM
jgi:hypothetical protein